MRVTFLGTGTSHGVPMIGCQCAVCRSTDPRDRRSRPSILLTLPSGTCILVDTSTDLRAQALANGISRVDAIVFTHSHADHIFGFDEIRRFPSAPHRRVSVLLADLSTILAHHLRQRAEETEGLVIALDHRDWQGSVGVAEADVSALLGEEA